MRCFRLYQRNKRGKIVKHRDYIGLENLLKFGKETYDRYNRPESNYDPTTAELSEKIDGKWKKLTEEQVKALL